MREKFKVMIISFLCCMMLISSSYAAEEKSSDRKVPAEKAAVVNGNVITMADFNRRMSQVRMEFRRQKKRIESIDPKKLKVDVLENLIEWELLYRESQKKGVEIKQSRIDGEWENFIKQFTSDDQLRSALEEMNLTETSMKAYFEKRMATQEFIDTELATKVTLGYAEMKAYYDEHPNLFMKPEQVRARHILIKRDDMMDDAKAVEAREKLLEIREKLQKGEDFAALAAKHSQGPSAKTGGDLGFFGKGQMVKPFEEKAFSLEPGEISDVVETRFGYHLIKVEEKKPGIKIPYTEVDEKIEKHLNAIKLRKEISRYVTFLKENSKIKRFLK